MSVVVLGGHERMEKQYKNIGEKHGCKVKVFTKNKSNIDKRIGSADYIVMFTDVISHKLINVGMKVSKKNNIPNVKYHNSSINSFENILRKVT